VKPNDPQSESAGFADERVVSCNEAMLNMLALIQQRTTELLDFESDVSPIFLEGVIRFFDGHFEQLLPGHIPNQYVEFLRSQGLGRNHCFISRASIDSWLLNDFIVDVPLFERMLKGALIPVFRGYSETRRTYTPNEMPVISGASVTLALLAAHTNWIAKPSMYGPPGELENYFIVAESIIREAEPELAENLALHYSEFVQKTHGCASFVRKALAQRVRLPRITESLSEFWQLYLADINQRVSSGTPPKSIMNLNTCWEEIIQRYYAEA
jgi:hypothetical protein